MIRSLCLLTLLGATHPAALAHAQAEAAPSIEERMRSLERQLQELKSQLPPPAAEAPAANEPAAPFAFADFSWAAGNGGASEHPLSNKVFTGEFRVDTVYHYSFNQPIDDTISGSSEVFRHAEFQVTQLGVGGDLFYKNVMGRLMTQFGMYSQ